MRDPGHVVPIAPSRPFFGSETLHPGMLENEPAIGGARLARVLDTLPQLVWTASADGRLLYCNAEVRKRIGPCEGSPVERIIPEKLVRPCDRPRWIETWRRALAGGQPYEVEYGTLSPGETTPRWYLERGTRVDTEGDADRWFVTATRIDEQKRREEELIGVLLRKERFLVTLLHELRNPLAPIANATALLATHAANPQAVSSARGVVERQLQQLTRIVDDLLDVSRSARGTLALQRAPVDLRHIVSVAVETAQPLIEHRRHCLAMSTPPSPVVVHGDPSRLCQVFSNLLINAAKYTNPGGRISVSIKGRRSEAIVRIRDSGIGISPDALPRIFEMFAQASPESDAARGGLGVGLAIARQLIQLHAGSLSAHSDGCGCGSEFVVRLPRSPQSE